MSRPEQHVHMRPKTAEIPVHPRKWLDRKRAQLRARKKNRERKRRLKQGHRARREAAAVRRIRHEIARVVAFLSAPRVMYDSVDVSQIPLDAKAAAGYVGGAWPTFASGALRRWLPHARLVSIAVASRHRAEELDIEPGDATPRDAPGFVRHEHGEGVERPAVYAAVTEMEAVLDELDDGGIHPDAYRIHTAHIGAGKHICGPGTCGLLRVKADATQWTFTSNGRNLDESVCRPSFWVGRPKKRRQA
jgi:hypothetical protein